MPKIKKDNIPRKVFSARIDESIVDALKIISAIEKKDMYEIVEEALNDYIDKKKDKVMQAFMRRKDQK